MEELTEEKKKRLRAAVFLFEQELSRGNWDVEKEIDQLLEFVEKEKQEDGE